MRFSGITDEMSDDHSADMAMEQFYSVEFSMNYPKLLYQFKLWNSASRSMFIIVKEGSEVLMRLKQGSVFKTRYYSTDALNPLVDLETQIKDIIKDEDGRFKGHYLVGLDILNTRQQPAAH